MPYPAVSIDMEMRPIGVQAGSAIGTAVNLTMPAGANGVLLQSTSGTAYWSLSGTAGTVVGFVMPPALDPLFIPIRGDAHISVLGTVQYQFVTLGQ